ncbi:MMPL family transporter [Sphaerisporangium sp. TRM90804]|uniref:MMPL family transporter n=1 Tax=Sphaerisporangium sp. TRM90804 TaxID=3031113 RepID=UPI00244BD376|nr:MMPL family transporter [Sphaerisporangium sp. TRM90804]MDH2428782.1 MMPL family transporter [Sphaerisporangium sp. TRM90804]
MLDVIGSFTTRRAWWVLAAWAAALAAAVPAWLDTLPVLLGPDAPPLPGPGPAGSIPSGPAGPLSSGGPATVPGGHAATGALTGALAAPGGGVPLWTGSGGVTAAVAAVVFAALTAFLRSPVAAMGVLLAAVAVQGLSAVLVSAMGLPVPPALFAYGTAAGCALMLAHRFGELLTAGDRPPMAVRTSLDQVGGVVATGGAAWMASCGALPLAAGAWTPGLGPALAVTAAVGIVVPLTLLPALLAALGGRLSWTPRRRRAAPPTAAARLGRAVAARPGPWTAGAAVFLTALGAAGLVASPPPLEVVGVAGVLTALVLALVWRSLVSPAYVASGATAVAWATGSAATGAGGGAVVFMFGLVTAVSTALLMLARVRETARAGRDPRTSSALAVRYAGPAALAAPLAAGTLTALVYGVVPAFVLVAGCGVLSLVVVPGLTALLGTRAWWPGTATTDEPAPVLATR